MISWRAIGDDHELRRKRIRRSSPGSPRRSIPVEHCLADPRPRASPPETRFSFDRSVDDLSNDTGQIHSDAALEAPSVDDIRSEPAFSCAAKRDSSHATHWEDGIEVLIAPPTLPA